MAKRGAQLDSEKFSCSICLDLLKDPVTVPCGHSYCSTCINRHWDGEKNKGSYSCPQCGETFRRKPDLKKDIMVAELVEDVKDEDVLLPQAQPETRDDFLQYSQQITLDPNTAQRRLLLSEGTRKVTLTRKTRRYSDHPDRFTDYFQVLSRESLTGRRYWEVEWTGEVDVAVAYKDISRSGRHNECVFGLNDKSWSLYCHSNRFTFRHNDTGTPVPGPWSSRVGVYLDHTAGVLSFYSVSGTMTLLHRVQTSFTRPLHAGVYLYYFNEGASAEFLTPQ